MCTGPGFTSPAEALAAVRDGLEYLNAVDAAGLTAAEQADCLRELERAESALTAARSVVLAGFDAVAGSRMTGTGRPGPG